MDIMLNISTIDTKPESNDLCSKRVPGFSSGSFFYSWIFIKTFPAVAEYQVDPQPNGCERIPSFHTVCLSA